MGFDEKLKKSHIILGWMLLIPYCFYLIAYIPGIRRISLWLEIAFVLFYVPILISSFKKLKGKVFQSIGWILMGFALIMLFDEILYNSIIRQMLVSAFSDHKISNGNQVDLSNMLAKKTLIFGLAIVILGPVLEEIMYRLVCFRSIYTKSPFAAHAVTALLFGLQHIVVAVIWKGNIEQIVNIFGYMIFSLILTKIYVKKKNIWICIGIHMLNNLFGVILMLASH